MNLNPSNISLHSREPQFIKQTNPRISMLNKEKLILISNGYSKDDELIKEMDLELTKLEKIQEN